MKKQLLIAMMALLSFAGVQAYELGDYVYTADAKFKVIGDNLVQNGDFSAAIANEWQSADMSAYNPEYWSIENAEGVSCLQSLSAADGASLYQAVPVTFGHTYVITMRVKAGPEGPFSTVVTEGSAGRIDVFANADGSTSKTATGFFQVADGMPVQGEWTDVNFAFTDTIADLMDGGFLNIVFEKLAAGTQVTSVEVREVAEVYDTRLAERQLAYAKEIRAIPDFVEPFDDLDESILGMEDALADPSISEDISTMEALMEDLSICLTGFLDINAADLKNTTGDWSTWSGTNYKGLTNRDSWSFNTGSRPGAEGTAGNRWSFSAAQDVRETVASEGYVAVAGIQISYNLDAYATVSNANLPAGKYFFSIEARAHHSKYKNNSDYGTYGADYAEPIVGPYMVLGNDTVKYENDTIPARYYKTYYQIFEVAEGETLSASFFFPVDNLKKGGVFRLRNPQLRQVGVSQLKTDYGIALTNMKTQQDALKLRLDSIQAIKAKAEYPWGKGELQVAYDEQLPLYEESLTYMDAEGNDLGSMSQDRLDLLNQWGNTKDGVLVTAVRALNSAINAYYTLNAPYTTLVATIAEGNGYLSNPDYAGASGAAKSGLQNAVNDGQQLVDAVTPDNSDTAEAMTAATEAINKAIDAFKMSVASFKTPADLAIINPFFKQNGGEKSRSAEGWTITGQTDNGTWKFKQDKLLGSDDYIFEGYNLHVDRGSTAFSKNKAVQKYIISEPGYYVYDFIGYAFLGAAAKSDLMVITTTELEDGTAVNDTLRDERGDIVFNTNVFSFFGPENAPDSVQVYTDWTGSNYYDITEVKHYEIGYNKTTAGDEVVEFGMDAMFNADLDRDGVEDAKGANCYGFGNNHLYFYGDYDKYVRDREEWLSVIEEVAPEQRTVVKGIYTLSGVKLQSERELPKGIYVINGRKVVIK